MKFLIPAIFLSLILLSCKNNEPLELTNEVASVPFEWSNASVYFMLTDRFANGDTSNEVIIPRTEKTGKLRGYEGGDFKGITQKIKEGYFTDLGVQALWLTPIWEQIHGGVDEGTGVTYAFHGYWAKDWTAIEPALGTLEDFKELVQAAHDQEIRVLLDVVINHTGPVTELDEQWPNDWVITGPACTYQDQQTAVTCTLTNNLPDIRTDSEVEVELPEFLTEKWKKEGRYDQEIKELDAFFTNSGLPRTPVNHIIKWVTDYARETGVDGFRVDTVKHVEESVWAIFIEQSRIAYEQWKKENPTLMIHNDPFFVLGELYGYNASSGRAYGFSSGPVDYFDAGFDAMINFQFRSDANMDYKTLFNTYESYRDSLLIEKKDDPVYMMNYISSHDDGYPFDASRERTYESASKLLLSPGMAQIYYGDEVGRSLVIPGTQGDATLRSNMDWDRMESDLLKHWQLLGMYRKNHPAVGAGEVHTLEHDGPGVINARFFESNDFTDRVIIGAGLTDGALTVQVDKVFKGMSSIRNAYTGTILPITEGSVDLIVVNGVFLLEAI
jgi:alpha-amylase